jgi:DNA-binding transcriptional MocR family regulator
MPVYCRLAVSNLPVVGYLIGYRPNIWTDRRLYALLAIWQARTDQYNPMAYADVYETLITRLANGQVAPGERINAAAFAKMIGVSTTPIWEALSQLAGRDIVEKRHRDGFYLARLSGGAIADLYAIHAFVIDLAFERWPAARPIRSGRDPWPMFERIVAHSSDVGLIGVARYLSDRLQMLRRFERHSVEDLPAITSDLAKAIRARNVVEARAASRCFHEACHAAAQQLSDAYGATR